MEKLDYLIIGSGIAGLHTAYRLNQQGKKVLVLEKESYIGGRMSSHEFNGNFIDFGAKFIANAYKYMIPLAKELGVEAEPINLTKAAIRKEGKLYMIDGAKKLSVAFGYRGISLKAKIQLGLAILYGLVKYRNLDLYNLETALYLDDKNTYDDFRKIAGTEGFDHVIEPFSRNVLFYSTKDLSRAAFYSLFPKFKGIKTFSFPRGIGHLCEKMASQVPMEQGVEVRSIKRTSEGVVVKAFKNGEEVSYHAEKAVLAVPGNRVLDILDNPLPEEKDFFSQIRYASTVQILCEGKTDLFSETNIIWTLPKEESNFTALGSRGYHPSDPNAVYFIAALRESTFHHLRETNSLNPETFKSLIQKEFPQISDIKVVYVQIWESATPKIYAGYVKHLSSFLNRKNQNNGVYFCGDYLENPSTEGALTSSVKLLERIGEV